MPTDNYLRDIECEQDSYQLTMVFDLQVHIHKTADGKFSFFNTTVN